MVTTPLLLIATFGQNLASWQYPSSSWEPSLATLCATRNYTVYHLDGIRSWATVNGLPGVDFSFHCRFPTNVFPGWPTTSANGLSLLNCPQLGKDIAICQALGKKVLLSINPLDFLVTNNPAAPNYAPTVATNIWNIFLGGTSKYRTFGSGVVLDGVDIKIRNNNNVGVSLFVQTLRGLMGSKYLIAASPMCSVPDYIISATDITNYNYLVPYFIQSPNICGYAGNNPPGFWSSLSTWSTYANSINLPLAIGLIAWYVEPWAQGSLGDYIPPKALVNDGAMKRMLAGGVSGFALQDASFDALNLVCGKGAMGWTYSDLMWRQMLLPAASNSSSEIDRCLAQAASVTTTTSAAALSTRTLVSTAGVAGGNGQGQQSPGTIACLGTCSAASRTGESSIWMLTRALFVLIVTILVV